MVLVVRHFVVAVEFSETYVSNMEAVGKGAVGLRFLDDVQLSITYDHQLTSKVFFPRPMPLVVLEHVRVGEVLLVIVRVEQ